MVKFLKYLGNSGWSGTELCCFLGSLRAAGSVRLHGMQPTVSNGPNL
jgi:hypothetical protein